MSAYFPSILTVSLNPGTPAWSNCFGVARQEAVGRQLSSLLPAELASEIAARGDQEQITGIYSKDSTIRANCLL